MKSSPASRCPTQIKLISASLRLLVCLSFLWLFCPRLGAEHSVLKPDQGPFELIGQQAASPALKSILLRLDERSRDFEMDFGIYPAGRPKVHILSRTEFETKSRDKSEIVENSQAFYSAADSCIYIRTIDQVNENYLKILMHEYLHWYIDALFVDAPLWFHEGMATYYAGQMGYERYLMYLRQSFLGKKGNLYRLSYSYPALAEDWPYFYEASAMALRFMKEKHPESWKYFWDSVAFQHRQGQKMDFNHAFIRCYNKSLYDLHREFETYSKRQGYLYLAVALNSILFLMAALIVPLAAIKRKKRLQLMEEITETELD